MEYSETIRQRIGTSVLFVEKRVAAEGCDAALANLLSQGFVLRGRHVRLPIYWLSQGETHVLLHAAEGLSAPEAVGVLVENVETLLPQLWELDEVDVCDGGKVGPLSLSLPAIRTKDGRWIYLVNAPRKAHFAVEDFEQEKETYGAVY